MVSINIGFYEGSIRRVRQKIVAVMSFELFYLDERGEIQDADPHEEILNNPTADLICRKQSFTEFLKRGVSPNICRQLLGRMLKSTRQNR